MALPGSIHPQTMGNISTNVVALYKALGGGWQAAKPGAYVPASVRKKMEARTDWGEMLGSPVERPPAGAPAAKKIKKRIPGKVGG